MSHPAFGSIDKALLSKGGSAPRKPKDAKDPKAGMESLDPPPPPPAPLPGPVDSPDDEPEMTQAEEAALEPNARPPKRYKWVEEDDFSIDAFLADQATATLQIFDTPKGSMTIAFRLLTEDDKADAEALTAPLMRRFYWNEQVNRWTSIAMCAACIEKIDGKEWMKGKSLEERIKALRSKRSLGMMDRILGAFREFQEHTIWLSRELDPKGS